MAQEAIFFMSNFIAQIWRLFTSWELPWLNFSPAQFLYFYLFFRLAVRLVKSFLILDHSFFGRAMETKFREYEDK